MTSTQTVVAAAATARGSTLGSLPRARARRWTGLVRVRSLSLQWEMGLLLITGLLLLFGLFALLSSRLSNETARSMAADRLSVARLTVTLIDQQFEQQFEELEWTAQRLAARGPNTRLPRSEILEPSEPFITRLTRVDAQGRVQWSEPVGSDTADRWRGETLGLGGVGLAIALFLVWVTRRGVVKPLTALTQRSLRIAAGDLGSPVPVIGTGEVRVLAQTLEDMRAQLSHARATEQHLSMLKDEFLATASHELRSPVASLSMFSQMILSRSRRGDPIDIQATLQEIRGHAERLNGLVNRLLDTSRIHAGKLDLAREPTDLAELAREVVRMAQVIANERSIGLDSPPSAWANVDRLRVAQVLSNLVDNAIKFSPPGGRIDVQVALSDGTARLSVRDRGPGIPPSLSEQVFERFYKAPGEGSPQGLGLGLYISRQIVELHGGSIRAESPPDGGTRFVVSLPTAD